MIGKIISLPFWAISRVLGLFTGILKLLFSSVFSLLRFIFNHLIGTILGAVIGFVLGRKHIGVKIFTHKKKHH